MDNSLFDVAILQETHGCSVYLSGEIDYAASLELMPRFEEVARKCEGELLFDLEQVTLIDSEGVKALLATFKLMYDRSQRAKVVRWSPIAGKVMKLTGVEAILTGVEEFPLIAQGNHRL